MISRRELLTGASALAAYSSIPQSAEALSEAQRMTLLGGASNPIPAPPEGFFYLVDTDGAYIVDTDGAYLLTQ